MINIEVKLIFVAKNKVAMGDHFPSQSSHTLILKCQLLLGCYDPQVPASRVTDDSFVPQWASHNDRTRESKAALFLYSSLPVLIYSMLDYLLSGIVHFPCLKRTSNNTINDMLHQAKLMNTIKKSGFTRVSHCGFLFFQNMFVQVSEHTINTMQIKQSTCTGMLHAEALTASCW